MLDEIKKKLNLCFFRDTNFWILPTIKLSADTYPSGKSYRYVDFYLWWWSISIEIIQIKEGV